MKVAKYPKKLPIKKTTLIFGCFESFHYGHIALIDRAKKIGLPITLLMFENPNEIPNKEKTIYGTLNTRLMQAANYGIDQVLLVTFTKDIKNKTGIDFLFEIIELTNSSKIVVGEDFTMGNLRTFSAKDIKNVFSETEIVKFIKFRNVKLSTTFLKELVEIGDVEIIRKLSPFSYTIETRVNTDGYFDISTIKPHNGIYATFATINDVKYWSLVKIGFENNIIIIPDLKLKNQNFDVFIEMQKLTRVITRKDNDIITDEDYKQVAKYLKNI